MPGANVGIAVLWNAKMKLPEKRPMRMMMNLERDMVSRRGIDRSICFVSFEVVCADGASVDGPLYTF
jgi:hypothetical protein